MSFKDAVAADVKNVFLNPLEFADEHIIDGQPVMVAVDDDVIEERRGRSDGGMRHAEGVFQTMKMLYVAQSDLPRVPVRDELLEFDGEYYRVDKVSINMGMLEIAIEANET